RCRASAFLLQALSQSRIMVGSRDNFLPGMERAVSPSGAGHSQVTHSYIHPCNCRMRFRSWVWRFNLQRNQQVKLLLGFVVPELSSTNLGTFLDKCHMLVIACVGNNSTAFQSQDAYLGVFLEAVI